MLLVVPSFCECGSVVCMSPRPAQRSVLASTAPPASAAIVSANVIRRHTARLVLATCESIMAPFGAPLLNHFVRRSKSDCVIAGAPVQAMILPRSAFKLAPDATPEPSEGQESRPDGSFCAAHECPLGVLARRRD